MVVMAWMGQADFDDAIGRVGPSPQTESNLVFIRSNPDDVRFNTTFLGGMMP
jgi:hypothetical protein